MPDPATATTVVAAAGPTSLAGTDDRTAATVTVPERSDAQRTAALERAQHVRTVQAEVKQLLKSGEVTLARVLDRAEDADEVARMRVSGVLRALPRIGPVRARRIMERLDIASSRRLGGLGPRQREALLEEFPRDAG